MTRFAIRRLDTAGVSVVGNLVKADAYQRLAEADRLLAEVEAEGRRAYEDAVARGRQAGEAEGSRASAELMANSLAAVRAHARKSEKRLTAIVIEAVRRILGEFEETELAARMVRQLVREADGEGKIRLCVSSGEFQAIQDRAAEMQRAFPGVEAIEVMADPDVEPGGCRMESELGFVTTSVEAQLEVLRAALEYHPVE